MRSFFQFFGKIFRFSVFLRARVRVCMCLSVYVYVVCSWLFTVVQREMYSMFVNLLGSMLFLSAFDFNIFQLDPMLQCTVCTFVCGHILWLMPTERYIGVWLLINSITSLYACII